MGILFSLGFEWSALLNLLWPVTGLLQQPSKESKDINTSQPAKLTKPIFESESPGWLVAGTWYSLGVNITPC